jgi:apolipoprotein D and lipocalin family protein
MERPARDGHEGNAVACLYGATIRAIPGNAMNALLIAVSMLAAGQVQAPGPVQTVAAVDLNRYVGDWYEIARFPAWFQNKCTADVRASYAKRPDGRIDVVNRCRQADGTMTEARGVARVVDARTFAKLQVRFAPAALSFLPFVWGDYWVLGLADDYSWAVVGSPDRKFLWVLARAPQLAGPVFESALATARANGFDVGRLIMTKHSAAPPAGGESAR